MKFLVCILLLLIATIAQFDAIGVSTVRCTGNGCDYWSLENGQWVSKTNCEICEYGKPKYTSTYSTSTDSRGVNVANVPVGGVYYNVQQSGQQGGRPGVVVVTNRLPSQTLAPSGGYYESGGYYGANNVGVASDSRFNWAVPGLAAVGAGGALAFAGPRFLESSSHPAAPCYRQRPVILERPAECRNCKRECNKRLRQFDFGAVYDCYFTRCGERERPNRARKGPPTHGINNQIRW